MDRLPPLRLLQTFAEVARLGSMRAAAERLNVTKPAVTQALQALEEHVGAALLDRSTRPAGLTEAGDMLALATRNGLNQIQGAIDAIRIAAEASGTRVTLACTLGMATYWLMPRLTAFYAAHPDITVNVQAPPGDLPVRSREIDIALRYGAGEWNDGATIPLFTETICPVGRPDLVARLLAEGRDLSGVPLIHVRSGMNPHWAGWADYLRRSGRGRMHGPGQSFDNYVQATQAAVNGLGIMLGWRSITGRLVADGALRAWPDAALTADAAYFITTSPVPSPAAAALRDWLIAEGEAAD